ncbi:unnamed protein product, partial [Amoebophrya sp. A25]
FTLVLLDSVLAVLLVSNRSGIISPQKVDQNKMCSFWLTTFLLTLRSQLDEVNRFAVSRGPDLTVAVDYHGFSFVHNLLAITTSAVTDVSSTPLSSPETQEFSHAGRSPLESGALNELHQEAEVDGTPSAHASGSSSSEQYEASAPSRTAAPKLLLRRANAAANSIDASFSTANVALLFNGEIYNYRELLHEHGLASLFTTRNSGTYDEDELQDPLNNAQKKNGALNEGETLVRLYRRLGPRFISFLDGEFALA